jgi:spore maturation protein CgeB
MTSGLNIAFFGSSLVSAYWNGAATYYRGMIRALAARGHRVTFYEPDAYQRQQHRDIPDPDWAKVVVYSIEGLDEVCRCLESAADADLIVKASGVGAFDELLEREVLSLKTLANSVAFWDVDAPATLERVQTNADDPFGPLIPHYDLILTYGGGPPVVNAYKSLGAQDCVPIYNALDPETHHPVSPDPRFACSLAFLGNRMPDRETRVQQFFFAAAVALPQEKFILGGNGWQENSPDLPNVRYLGHVYTQDHNALNCTPRAVLNISRESMARFGYSPATRVFEAAGAGACLITDAWEGIELFLEPEREVLVAGDGNDVAEQLARLTEQQAREIGEAALRRVLAEHTYTHRAEQLEQILSIDAVAKRQAHAVGAKAAKPSSGTPAHASAGARKALAPATRSSCF